MQSFCITRISDWRSQNLPPNNNEQFYLAKFSRQRNVFATYYIFTISILIREVFELIQTTKLLIWVAMDTLWALMITTNYIIALWKSIVLCISIGGSLPHVFCAKHSPCKHCPFTNSWTMKLCINPEKKTVKKPAVLFENCWKMYSMEVKLKVFC